MFKYLAYIKGGLLTMLAIFLVVQSCNDLDLEPLDRVTTSTYYKTPGDFDGAMFAAYSSVQDFWGTSTETLGERNEYQKMVMVTTDDVVANPNRADGRSQDLDNLNFRPADVPFQSLFAAVYEGILRCNLVIEQAASEDNELTAEEKTLYDAEAKFMRAFFHFQALKMWGTPPIVTQVLDDLNNLAVGNATRDELFAAILGDFQDAFNGLPVSWDNANLGRATKWAARAYEGKVNVWKEDWPAAIAAFEDVIANGPYALMDNYEDAFAYDMENNAESIFEIQFGGPYSDDNIWVFDDTHSEAFKASQGATRIYYWDAGGGGAPGGHNGWWDPSQDLVDEYEEGDPRLHSNIYMDGDMYYTMNGTSVASVPYDPAWSSTGYTIKKYRGQRNVVPSNHSPNGQADFTNERWYRYAEMLLLYAEALIQQNRSGEAMNIINNEIRARVGLGPSPMSDPMEALMHEKRVEMPFEVHRWFDITRWGIGGEIFDNWQDRYNLFPFPQSEIDRSGNLVVQNEGY